MRRLLARRWHRALFVDDGDSSEDDEFDEDDGIRVHSAEPASSPTIESPTRPYAQSLPEHFTYDNTQMYMNQ